MNAEADDPDVRVHADGQGRRGPMKFAYASGARPLDGYTIKRGIGAGGFGDVYYATSDAGKEVALKRIQRNLDVELRGVRQCLNLKHVNLLAIYDIRYDDVQQAWVVMEYVAGESLQDVIERNPSGLPEDEVLNWFEGIAHGVAYLHDHGIVHRDLKPGNIFLDQGTVKIGDYGLSKFISCSRRSGQTESVGTFHYMAPEIGLGRYGKEIDIYALGILLYEMLCGHVPFEGESSQEIIMKHLTTQPDLTRIPPAYRAVIGRAMAKDPADRFQSIAEMAQALGQFRNERPAGAQAWTPPPLPPITPPRTPKSTVGRAWNGACQWARRHPQEPLAAAFRQHAHQFKYWWREQTSGARAMMVVAAVIVVAINSAWLFPALFGLGAVYLGYYLVWYLLHHVQQGPTPLLNPADRTPNGLKETIAAPPPTPAPAAAPQPAASVAGPMRRRQGPTRQQINDAMREALARKTWAQRASELTGSMLMAALVVAVVGLVMTVAGTRSTDGGPRSWGPVYAWLCITSVAATWTVLFFSKLWETSTGDHALRRFCLTVCGMLVGVLASLLAQALVLDPVYLLGPWRDFRHSLGAELPGLYGVNGQPQTLAYAGYFGGLFLTLRWWLGADPLRSVRLSLFSIALTVGVALLWYLVLPIPRGFMVAGTTAVAVQLAAPWVHPRQRYKFKERLLAA
jgi:hypothetical protein